MHANTRANRWSRWSLIHLCILAGANEWSLQNHSNCHIDLAPVSQTGFAFFVPETILKQSRSWWPLWLSIIQHRFLFSFRHHNLLIGRRPIVPHCQTVCYNVIPHGDSQWIPNTSSTADSSFLKVYMCLRFTCCSRQLVCLWMTGLAFEKRFSFKTF